MPVRNVLPSQALISSGPSDQNNGSERPLVSASVARPAAFSASASAVSRASSSALMVQMPMVGARAVAPIGVNTVTLIPVDEVALSLLSVLATRATREAPDAPESLTRFFNCCDQLLRLFQRM